MWTVVWCFWGYFVWEGSSWFVWVVTWRGEYGMMILGRDSWI